MGNKHITITIHGIPTGLKQDEFEAAEHSGHGDVHLRVRERHAQAAARALTETNHVSRQVLSVGRFGVVEPALRPEGEAIREDGFVVGDGEVGHGNHRLGREHVGFVRDYLCLRGAGIALGGTVG